MDINKALKDLREMLAPLAEGEVWGDRYELVDTINEIAEVFANLDGWMSGGGFLPADWERPAEEKVLHLLADSGPITVTQNGVTVEIDEDNPHSCILSEAVRCLACEGQR